MRGVFNKTATLAYGERSVYGPPLTVYAVDVPCRVVPQTEIAQEQFPFTLSGHWITLDQGAPNGPFTSSPWAGATFTDYKAADLVVVDNPSANVYACVRREYVTPFEGDPYWRTLLIPVTSLENPPWLPPVPPPPAPPGPPVPPFGTSCEDAPDVALDVVQSGTITPEGMQWRLYPLLPGGTYHIAYDMENTGPYLQVFVGNCTFLSLLASLSGLGCWEFTLPFDYNVYVVMGTADLDSYPYEFVVSEGTCPLALARVEPLRPDDAPARAA